jgi:DNA (cytosine-5)-methyltransferase 1
LNKLKLGSLFDGIGGFPLSAQRHGIEPVWASEIEPFPIKVTQHHFPNMKHLGDITQINGAEIEPVDIITFGSPCQDLSVAGKREGLQGERSGLFMDAVRIIREMRRASGGEYPRFIVWENVPGAFSSNKGEDFRAVLSEIAETEIPMPRSGKWANAGMVRTERIDIAWRVLDAQYWGVPQRRRRIFLVADFGGQSAAEILFKPEGLRGDIAESGEARQGATTDVKRSIRKTKQYLFENHSQDTRYVGPLEVSPIVSATFGMGGNNQPFVVNRAYSIQGSMIGRADKNGPQGDGINENVSFTLNTTDRHAVAFACNQRDEVRDMKDKSGALQAQPGMKQQIFVATKVYGICSDGSNSMKSDNPHSGIYEDETTRTLDQNGGNPACNQGGMTIVQCIEPGALSRGQGERVWDKCPTLRAKMGDNQPCVVLNDQGGSQIDISNDVVGTLRAEMHGNIPAVTTCQKVSGPLMANTHPGSYTGQDAHSDMLVTPYQETVGSLCARDYKGIGNQYVSEDKCIIAPKYSVRRLTPLECERLQGFPDGWTDIPGASDTARYKALGNSVAIPCVDFVMSRIAEVLRTK